MCLVNDQIAPRFVWNCRHNLGLYNAGPFQYNIVGLEAMKVICRSRLESSGQNVSFIGHQHQDLNWLFRSSLVTGLFLLFQLLRFLLSQLFLEPSTKHPQRNARTTHNPYRIAPSPDLRASSWFALYFDLPSRLHYYLDLFSVRFSFLPSSSSVSIPQRQRISLLQP